jgi:hypothetical protein
MSLLDRIEEAGVTVARSLPQAFFDRVSAGMNVHPWTQFVWVYPADSVFGLPCPLEEGARDWCEEQGINYFDAEAKNERFIGV